MPRRPIQLDEIAVIFSGANVDLATLKRVIGRGSFQYSVSILVVEF
jgi:hypothetical protein